MSVTEPLCCIYMLSGCFVSTSHTIISALAPTGAWEPVTKNLPVRDSFIAAIGCLCPETNTGRISDPGTIIFVSSYCGTSIYSVCSNNGFYCVEVITLLMFGAFVTPPNARWRGAAAPPPTFLVNWTVLFCISLSTFSWMCKNATWEPAAYTIS